VKREREKGGIWQRTRRDEQNMAPGFYITSRHGIAIFEKKWTPK
jgi:hypothetical protein